MEKKVSLLVLLKDSYYIISYKSQLRWWNLFFFTILGALSAAIMVMALEPFLAALSGSESKAIEIVQSILGADFVNTTHKEDFILLGGIAISAIIIANIIQIIRVWLFNVFLWAVLDDLSLLLLRSFMMKDYEDLKEYNPNELSAKILAELERVVNSYYRHVADIVSAIMTSLMVFIVLLSVNFIVTISSFFLISFIYFIIYFYTKMKIQDLGFERTQSTEKRFKLVTEIFASIREIKISNNASYFMQNFTNNSKRLGHSYTLIHLIGSAPYYLLQTIIFSGIILLCIFLLLSSGSGKEQFIATLFPLLGVFAFAGQRLLPELNKIFQGITEVRYGIKALEEVAFEIKKIKTISDTEDHAGKFSESFEELTFEDVSYSFLSQNYPVISKMSLSILAGDKILIVGKTGSGKSRRNFLVRSLIAR